MKIFVTEQARRSLLGARDFYNNELDGLGYELVHEFLAALSRFKLIQKRGHRFQNVLAVV